MERRALYNSLRLNWKMDPTLQVKPWQVEDLRLQSLEQLFQALQSKGIALDRFHFAALAESIDSPEDLAEIILTEEEEDQETSDQVYLIVFEIWRRLLPERQTLSLFCDELDYQISLYDAGELKTTENIEDTIANLQTLLEEHADEGGDPKILFKSISEATAHDVEGFLYDFIYTQLEYQNNSYAKDLVEAFLPFVEDKKWFEFLEAQVMSDQDIEKSHLLIHQLIKKNQKNPDLDFNLEMLSFLAKKGEERSFLQVAKQTAGLLQTEEDLWDFLSSCEDYFHYQDKEENERIISQLKKKRTSHYPPEKPVNSADQDLLTLQKLLS